MQCESWTGVGVEIKANRVTWRGTQYDSQLEADWHATFVSWGLECVYHPGWLSLPGSVVWEPDFQLDGDVVFEVKGDHDERVEKAWLAARETRLRVIVGRAGWIPPVNTLEHALAVWEPDAWVWTGSRFVHESEAPDGAGYSAHRAWAHGLPAVRWYKAVGEDGIV